MIATWANSYIGIPYVDRGRDRMGCDCWGLVRLVFIEQFDITLESLHEDYPSSADTRATARLIGRHLSPWVSIMTPDRQMAPPQAGDGILMRRMMRNCHTGIFVGPCHFIHAEEKIGVVLAELGYGRDARRWTGIFRHEQLA
ncbi:MAG: peptidoglycan endopeptidase [Alphaproteobacteria bacterium]|jgi:cell wall-associated NlpC family hydrolase|nr:peptidoglycan endopeptidase [Alphaproteobacteria bacterium]MBT5013830.1 peptidoglycan endopeptidase [Rhodospirillaceae bacterium]MBT6406738.1 peptidoglycan endopeptidase [Rhodospirillaceae bacterium]MBT7355361.1 peptidoglycan endopeptidase [Rhodospirillaceae bacterium]